VTVRLLPVLGLFVVCFASVHDVLARPWNVVAKRHFQLAEVTEVASTAEPSSSACPEGMVEVSGKMKMPRADARSWLTQSVEELQKTTCTEWINRDFPERCAVFDRDAWIKLSADLPTKQMHFCIDKYEFPNVAGQNPVVFVNWYDANSMSAAVDKRLCTEDEWTFACEGEEALPYPYGYVRDAAACNIDKTWIHFDEKKLYPIGKDTVPELDRLWQGVPSGTMSRCVSSFGVYDLTGNVDELTTSTRSSGNRSILKGGYWCAVRDRCRPSTRVHNENHMLYQEGFRSCRDPL